MDILTIILIVLVTLAGLWALKYVISGLILLWVLLLGKWH